MSFNEELIKKADIKKIAREGEKIYEKKKNQYEKNVGQFLAIDIGSEDVYLGLTSLEAVEKARKDHPEKVFYVVKIGYSVAETLANMMVGALC